ncbi:MAG: nucleotide pyrophosphohydrolase [Cellvibrionaceae bacterium]
MDSLDNLRQQLLEFARERDWEQFQSPKNLSMAICGEVGELAECFQWLTEKESRNLTPEQRARVADEVADVQLYLILLAARLDMDIIGEANRKMKTNTSKYPVTEARGNAKKYTELKRSP